MFGIWNELYVRNFACVGRAEEHVGVRQLELLYACMGGIPEGVCRSVHAGSLPVKPAGGNVVRNFLAATINAGAQRRLLHIIRKHLTGVRADFYPVADLLFDFLRYDVLNRHANRRVAGQIQRLPDIRRQLVRRDRSCLNSISRKKTGNDQVGGKAFARAERAPVPFAVICLCIGDPPFADGDKHLLHALELCEHGGQIACVLNAETIRNPYTNTRKLLSRELKKRGASIRFVRGGFKHSARKTDVEVALINVSIPVTNEDSSIWDNLKKASEATIESSFQNEVAPANQVERLLREYDLLCEAGITLMQKYNGVAPHIHNAGRKDYSHPIIELRIDGDNCSDICRPCDINRFLRAARARYWRELFDLPELREKMTSSMQDEYHGTIEKMKDYEFSEFNIRQVIDQIMDQLVVGVEAAILNCFDKLSAEHTYHTDVQNDNIHYYNGWKANKAHYVNMKCIIPTYGCFARGYKTDRYGRWKDTLEGLDVRGCFSTLDDLEKALDYIDCGETASTSLEQTLQIAARDGKTSVSCKYFDVVFYKKGTCHIKFRDQKIVDRMNIYVGRQRMWLPPTYGKVRYDDMDEESRRVVDEFQGREKYDEVMNAPGEYIIDTRQAPLLIA